MAIKETAQQIDELNIETKVWALNPFEAIVGAKWPILGLLFVSIVASLVISNMITPTYETSATISMSKSVQGALAQPAVLNQIADGDQFLVAVGAAIKSNYTEDALRDQISAMLVHNTNNLTILVTDSTGRRAQNLANASAKAFLVRTEPFELARARQKQMDLLEKAGKADNPSGFISLEDVETELEQLKQELPTVKQGELSESDRATYALGLRGSINYLEQRKQSLLSEVLAEGQTLIIAEAVEPRTPISPNIPRNVIFSAISALIIGATLAIAFRPPRFSKS